MLWLSCNSWYNFHYSLDKDREHIDRIKSDTSNQNKLYKEFKRIFTSGNIKEKTNLWNNIEQLHFALVQAELEYSGSNIPSEYSKFNLENVLIDFPNKTNSVAYQNLVIHNAKTYVGKLKKQYANAHDLGNLVLVGDIPKIFSGLLEIIYQVRCHLVHGSLNPIPENHEVVKYCYLILWDCLKGFYD
ncbi:TPA: hypothetical protein ACK3JR_000849 [Mannheimia haemolytica]